MIATFKPCKLHGRIDAPPSKSLAHRYLIGAALSGQKCTLRGVDYSEDVLASIDCLEALGAKITTEKDFLTVDPCGFMTADDPVLNCRESGSTLRFFIPLALTMGKRVRLCGSERLLERPLTVYEDIAKDKDFEFTKTESSLTVCGKLESGNYKIRGDISSQFITGLIFALVYLGGRSTVEIISPFESRSYIDLTVSALRTFGADVSFKDEFTIEIAKSDMKAYTGRIEGDYSNAAFLEAFNRQGSEIEIGNLNPESLQGDRVYSEYFDAIDEGAPTLDISDCPDLGPVLFALAALKNGATFTGTDRLKVKESDRGAVMDEELKKLGGGLVFGDNSITVPRRDLKYSGEVLSGHNDHRIVMALSVVLSVIGGSIEGAEAVKKSYPGFFDDIKALGAEVTLE